MMQASLVELDGISGYDEGGLIGAEFGEVEYMTPYYEREVQTVDRKPWYQQPWDSMNNTKTLNSPEVLDYREIELRAIPQEMYELVEGFGEMQNTWFKVVFFLCVVVVVWYLLSTHWKS